MKVRIHVNRQIVAQNKKLSGKDRMPVFSAKTYKQNLKGNEININGPCKLIYSPDKPLPCGAVAWIETDSEVLVVNGNFAESVNKQ